MGTNSMKTLQALAKAIVQAVQASRVDAARLNVSQNDVTLERQYIQAMIEGFESGVLTVHRESSLLPIRPTAPGAIAGALIVGLVSIEEANRWLLSIGSPIKLSPALFVDCLAPGSAMAIGKPARLTLKSDLVRNAAIRYANQVATEKASAGEMVSTRAVSSRVAILLNGDPDIPLMYAESSVRRHLLKDWSPQITLNIAGASGASGAWSKKVS